MKQQGWGAKVTLALEAQGRSVAWLAGRIKKDPSTMSRMIRGQDGYNVTVELAEAIARELQTPFAWLFEGTFEEEVKA